MSRSRKKKRTVSIPKVPLEDQASEILSLWGPTIPHLVQDLHSKLHEIRPLEEEAQTIKKKLHHQREEYLRELLIRYNRQHQGEELTLEEKVKAQAHLDSLHEMSEDLEQVAYEKIQVGGQVYDLIDDEIKRLDALLSSMEGDYPKETAVLREVTAHREHAKRLALRTQQPSSPSGTGQSTSIPMASPSDVKYCVCQAPAHGKMLSCDNETCLVEWFHLSCVGLKEPPKVGKWYCPECYELLGDPNGPKKKRRKTLH